MAYNFAGSYKQHPRYEDIAQACLLGLCEAALRWNPQLGAFSTYAYYWMKHYSGVEVQDAELFLPSGSFEDFTREDTDQVQTLITELHTPQVREVLFQSIHKLPVNEQHVILLKYPLDYCSRTYTDKEIAGILGCSVTWVRNLRRRAFRKLRKQLKDLVWKGS